MVIEFSAATAQLVRMALDEDIGSGDITSEATIAGDVLGSAFILARESLVYCSHELARYVCVIADTHLTYEPLTGPELKVVPADTKIAYVRGPVRSLLAVERTLLNFLQHLSGIATTTQQVVQSLDGLSVRLLDTRKTTPGWRELEKYAVRVGGGSNHRQGLYDAFLIKNNHIDALGGDIRVALQRCRRYRPSALLEVEVRSFSELTEALQESPDWILLDNMNATEIRQAVALVEEQAKIARKRPQLEASGGLTPDTVREIAATGVDAVSMGWLTHSSRAVDLSLRFEA